jgi:predicted enzyme related to lactoylglutathione lyase
MEFFSQPCFIGRGRDRFRRQNNQNRGENMQVEKVKYMIMAQDMKRALNFYSKTVGLKVAFETPDWSELNWGDTVVALHGGGDGSPKKTGLSFQVSDIDEACEKAKAAGATILRAPEDREGEPIFLADLRDPEGNEIMFTEYKF